MSHAYKCGTPLRDRRATFCPSCRGALVEQQELARKNAQLIGIANIDWDYVGIAVRMALEEIRANDPLVARADLFSRVSRPEWDAWGHEAGEVAASAA